MNNIELLKLLDEAESKMIELQKQAESVCNSFHESIAVFQAETNEVLKTMKIVVSDTLKEFSKVYKHE